jgi:hypothetical protein
VDYFMLNTSDDVPDDQGAPLAALPEDAAGQ